MQVPAGTLTPNGWAVECRITSEDPANGFLPSTGHLEFLRVPAGPGVRWDSGFDVGNEVTLHYDSMVAKLIVWGRDRPDALQRMVRALDELVVVGIATNQGFQRRLVTDPDFVRGNIDIQFLERRPDLAEAVPAAEWTRLAAVAAVLAEDAARHARKPAVAESDGAHTAWLARARAEGMR
jgi:acetyl-CoA carboxylase biotin carboxylase subunit